MIGCEPIGRPKHGEEEKNEGFESNGFPKSDELGLPAGVLHQDNASPIRSDDITGVAKAQSNTSTQEHEDDEPDVGTIGDSAVGLDIDILAERDLKRNIRICL